MSLNNTPNANRVHIGIFGKTNSGKSSLLNALTDQPIALVSDTPGTTTDPVYKAMEINPIGPCVFIDTAGFDDNSDLGEQRMARTKSILNKTDIAIMVFADNDFTSETKWLDLLGKANIPVLAVINKTDLLDKPAIANIQAQLKAKFTFDAISVSAKTKSGIAEIKTALQKLLPDDQEIKSITAHITSPLDVVMLVMPQDIQAPKGRLILPQVQTIRDLLDNKCLVLCVTTDNLSAMLDKLKEPPKVIITDSQVFAEVYKAKPEPTLLTSFSVLFARYKGDINAFMSGAKAIDSLTPSSKVLIAEACTHNPLDGDIGRIKLPKMLRKKVGEDLTIQVVSGNDFPENLEGYDLIIHCGACMFNRKLVLSRVQAAQKQNVPITNYGVAIANLTGILDQVTAY